MVGSGSGCRRPQPSVPTTEAPPPALRADDHADESPVEPPPDRNRIDGPNPEDKDRWLFVDEIKKGAKGAWAEGGFDRKRNKLTVDTHGVARFAVDFSRIPIDWDRLVVLRLDGFNSEFRRRQDQIVHFEVTRSGDWVVIERKSHRANP